MIWDGILFVTIGVKYSKLFFFLGGNMIIGVR